MSKVRMNIEVSQDVASFLEQIASEEATTKTEIVRRAISVLKAYKTQKGKGRNHIGFTSDADKLDAEIVGILDS
ncbi:hypothetical protein M2341_002025 [Sphingobium sp. B7D2B]|uniref:hypothetical protein n=1 Tax=Sphingobium sp. B7D2B TaxID=2940583 RepID=UPI002224638D|nr:hypothetical protein [Sphingobium sp. B7D2B]MCW2366578.1 hypothetical protein [Sphingobium sp. B7D2B]